MIRRYRTLTFKQLLALFDLANLLFAWNQAGDPAEPRDIVDRNVNPDEHFVLFLESLRGTVSSTAGRYSVLRKDSITPFLDYDQTIARVDTLAQIDGPLQERARGLMRDFENAARW
jgi:hypothetical protein